MSEAFHKFLRDRSGLLGAGARGKTRTRFRVFGLNPGWDDYFALGDDSETLLMAEEIIKGSLIYQVGEAVDEKGALKGWALLEKEGKAVAPDHFFLWARNRQSITGRLWQSWHGGGKPFPTVACIQSNGVEIVAADWFAELNDFKDACEGYVSELATELAQLSREMDAAGQAIRRRLAALQPQVRQVMDAEVQTIQKRLARLAKKASEATGKAANVSDQGLSFAKLADENREELIGYLRIFRERFADYARKGFLGKGPSENLDCQTTRVPGTGRSPQESISFLYQLLMPHLDASVPALFIAPIHGEWLDILVGEPARRDFFCLRAPTSVLPVDRIGTETGAFRAHASAVIDAFAEGRRMPSLFAELPAGPSESSGGRRPVCDPGKGSKGAQRPRDWIRMFLFVTIAVLMSGSVFWSLRSQRTVPAENAAPGAGGDVAKRAQPSGGEIVGVELTNDVEELNVTRQPPFIELVSTNVVGEVGEPMHLVATVRNATKLEWRFQDRCIGTNPVCTLVPQGSEDSGLYQVVAGNEDGAVTRSINVVVIQKPVISLIEPPIEVMLQQGDSREFTVSATGSEPMRYRWFLADSLLAETAIPKFVFPPNGPSLIGDLVVEATSAWGSSGKRKIARISVRRDPAAKPDEFANNYVLLGQPLHLKTKLAGQPSDFRWFKNGGPLKNSSSAEYRSERAAAKDGGRYTVISGVNSETNQVVWIVMTNSIGMNFVWVVPPVLTDGAGAWVGKYEVTQAEFEKVMHSNPAHDLRNPRRPADSVTGNEALQFCQALVENDRDNPDLKRRRYHLPTESQWSAFARGTSLEDSVTSKPPQPKRDRAEVVGSRPPNAQGLYDVRGNLGEWCLGDKSGDLRIRGGSYLDSVEDGQDAALRFDFSESVPADDRRKNVGFRCIMIEE